MINWTRRSVADTQFTFCTLMNRYVFVCNDWIKVHRDMSKRHAKALKLDTVEESHLTAAQSMYTRPLSLSYFSYETSLNFTSNYQQNLSTGLF